MIPKNHLPFLRTSFKEFFEIPQHSIQNANRILYELSIFLLEFPKVEVKLVRNDR